MITTSDIAKAVATVITELQVPCKLCEDLFTKDNYTICPRCANKGWFPTHDLHKIIINIKYPLTIVLTNDMIGWCAEIALDGDIPTGKNKTIYDDPVYAVYEALFEALTDKLGVGKMGGFKVPVKRPRRTRGRGRLIASVRTVQESVKWLQPGSES